MKLLPTGKNKQALLKTFSNISGNLSAGWFGFALISPGIHPPLALGDILALTIAVSAGILFLWFAYRLERESQ